MSPSSHGSRELPIPPDRDSSAPPKARFRAELSDAQRQLASHADGALLISGPPGSGRTGCLLERVAWLLARGAAPDTVLVMSTSSHAAAMLRLRLRERLTNAEGELSRDSYSEPAVLTPEAFCAGLLRDHALLAGLDPFFVVATKADRLAMLLARSQALRRSESRAQRSRARTPRRPAAMLRALERIDRLKEALVDADHYASWAAERASQGDPSAGDATALAELYLAHERMLAEHEALDVGDLLGKASALMGDRHVAGTGLPHRHVLIDDFEDRSSALVTLVERLAADVSDLTVAGDEHQLAGFRARHPGAGVVSLEAHPGFAPRIGRAADAVLAGPTGAVAARPGGTPAGRVAKSVRDENGEVSFWRCADERTQAQSVAADIERTILRRRPLGSARAGNVVTANLGSDATGSAGRIAVVVQSLARDGRSLVGALKERAIPHRVVGASEYFECAEVRDLVAWMRLLRDPLDTNAAIRLLMRSPVELRPAELARVIQLARRRTLDMPSALDTALELARFAPETRERIAAFLEVYGELALALAELPPDQLVHLLIARTGLHRARVLSSEAQAVEALASLARVEELASHFVGFAPGGSSRDFADYLAFAAEAGLSLEELVRASDAEVAHSSAAVEVMSLDVLPQNAFEYVYVLGLAAPRGRDRASMAAGESDARGGVPPELLAERLPAGADLHSPADLRWSLHRAITCARKRVILVHVARDADRLAQAPPSAAEDVRVALGGTWEDRQPGELDEGEVLAGAARVLRQRAVEDVARIGGRLGELRLDTDYDISHGVVRYLELLKLASLLERPAGQSFADALLDLNTRLLSACTPQEREMFESSGLDEALISALPGGTVAARVPVDTPEDSLLAAFLPRRGDGLILSVSDIETYRACPLRYKLARVLRIPAEPTRQQRFGIMVHKVLERYHSGWDGTPGDIGKTLATLLRLLDGAWRRAGFRESPAELALLAKARDALTHYHRQLAEQSGRPVWFERSFSFPVGPHLVRGRVDRIDQIPDDGYELIDYKTGHPRSPAQLEGDIQLSLYALAARQAWNLPATREAYYYVLDNRKVPLAHEQDDAKLEWVTKTIMGVGEGILALQFQPTPAHSVCSSCDYLTICPAAEA